MNTRRRVPPSRLKMRPRIPPLASTATPRRRQGSSHFAQQRGCRSARWSSRPLAFLKRTWDQHGRRVLLPDSRAAGRSDRGKVGRPVPRKGGRQGIRRPSVAIGSPTLARRAGSSWLSRWGRRTQTLPVRRLSRPGGRTATASPAKAPKRRSTKPNLVGGDCRPHEASGSPMCSADGARTQSHPGAASSSALTRNAPRVDDRTNLDALRVMASYIISRFPMVWSERDVFIGRWWQRGWRRSSARRLPAGR